MMRYEIRDGENGWILSDYEDVESNDILRGNPSEEHIFKKWSEVIEFLKKEYDKWIYMQDADMEDNRSELDGESEE